VDILNALISALNIGDRGRWITTIRGQDVRLSRAVLLMGSSASPYPIPLDLITHRVHG
jgi:hypothetical protein